MRNKLHIHYTKKNLLTGTIILLIVFTIAAIYISIQSNASEAYSNYYVESLNRGIAAFCKDDGIFISWRICADDDEDALFKLYRDGEKIKQGKLSKNTNYTDRYGTAGSKYHLEIIQSDHIEENDFVPYKSDGYFDISLNKPGDAYMPGDCSLGDIDGDGCYELFLKWEAQTYDCKDSGFTDPTYIDCIKLDGTRLWRINLGTNIRSGQHYTPMSVADFDSDGCAELIMKTADGTVDGLGKIIGDASASFVNENGKILDGPEYLTLFDGQTGEAIDTIEYPVGRGYHALWGDEKGYRCDRFNAGAAFLDGVHPTAIFGRGYYTRLTVSAVDVINKKLSVRWIFDTGNDEDSPAYGCGNHNLMAADVDKDGKQEICLGASCIDDDGTLKWSTGDGHGDAMHVGCFIENSNNIQIYTCREYEPYGSVLIDGESGEKIFEITGSKDTGRCLADDILKSNKGTEFLLSGQYGMYNRTGKLIDEIKIGKNFLVYWDDDIQRELLDDIYIYKLNKSDSAETIFTAEACISINDTKATPCLSADILGDWREELIFPTDDGTRLRVYCTTIPTDISMVTLMHDPQYRMQVACEQSCYNQPPHVGFNMSSKACRENRYKVHVLNK